MSITKGETRSVPSLSWVWRSAWLVMAVIALSLLAYGFVSQASSTIYSITMAFFLALAMEPAVGKLATRMPRAAATGLVMGAVLLGLTIFLGLFGSLLFQQLAQLVQAIPDVVTGIFDWVNSKFGTQYSTDTILSDLGLTTSQITSYADDIAGGVLGLVGGVLGAFLSLFSVTFFSYFMSAGLVRLRRWVAALFPARQQEVVLTTWEMLRIKVGGYVASRLVLAAISSLTSGIFMALIGMPYWLALALWTGLVAQFIPNVGTYIAIALPVVVGLTSTNPVLGVWVLIFAIAYQQVENLTLELGPGGQCAPGRVIRVRPPRRGALRHLWRNPGRAGRSHPDGGLRYLQAAVCREPGDRGTHCGAHRGHWWDRIVGGRAGAGAA